MSRVRPPLVPHRQYHVSRDWEFFHSAVEDASGAMGTSSDLPLENFVMIGLGQRRNASLGPARFLDAPSTKGPQQKGRKPSD